MAGRLKYSVVRRGGRREVERTPMWVFDGEEWTEEGVSEKTRVDAGARIPMNEFVPEMQVIEVVQVPKTIPMPPFPLP